ncbi:ABC transporter ATP-binding protein [Fictibacillus fluitans]|uniref:ABC transporter ATP-binding protein n=1 Tax=Fictibacillus fluitans TaxID=3058422 RepID=A0ABT8HTB5_9BACL|nr:ABC transporter ATP-binding protein [Fictibacillus sp. NE201]MDN4524028.1 ABC transporter ATP-binding protein [Fictibacillus sp. NE201]
MTYIIETAHLTKQYGEKQVVSDVSMKVKKGEIYGFLGQNGAGKTTIMKMITNLVRPTSGEIHLFGERFTRDSVHVMSKIGSIIEYPTLYGHLTAKETLQLHCDYMGFRDDSSINESLELVGLQDAGKKRVSAFSLGMKQRLGLARAIVTKPELLLLDEPINGLDPVAIKDMRQVFKTLQKQYGMTLFISSHILGEIELIADTVGIIRNGALVEEITMSALHAKSSGSIVVETNNANAAAIVLKEQLAIHDFEITNEKQLQIKNSPVSEHEITKVLVNHDIQVNSVYKSAYSLEQFFMEKMSGGALHV